MTRIPFIVDRKRPGGLVTQMADGFRQAIETGYYKAGDILPTLHELAHAFGTSLRVPREAISRLKAEGLVDPRQAIGSMVVGRRSALWLGHVLFILCDAPGSYYANVLAGELQGNLTQAGYLFTRVTLLDKPGGFDEGALDAALAQNISLAVLFCNRTNRIPRKLNRRGVPFMEIRGGERSAPPKCSSLIRFALDVGLEEFVLDCRNAGVKTVLQVCFRGECDIDAVPSLEAAGINVRREVFTAPPGFGRLEMIKRRAFKRFKSILSISRIKEDVVLFTDDFLADGALLAFVEAGISVPEDVKVVSFSNAGFGPVFVKDLTRLEMDPRAHGEAVSRHLLAALSGEHVPSDLILPSVYRKGMTF